MLHLCELLNTKNLVLLILSVTCGHNKSGTLFKKKVLSADVAYHFKVMHYFSRSWKSLQL